MDGGESGGNRTGGDQIRGSGASAQTGEDGDAGEDGSSSPFIGRFFKKTAGALGFGTDEAENAAIKNLIASAAPGEDPRGFGEQAMLLNILRLRDTRVVDVMVPRADIVAVEQGVGLAEVIEVFREASLTRLPVYRETLDDPLGFAHLKDLAFGFGFGRARPGAKFHLPDHLRPMLYIPPSMPTNALLKKMQATRIHMALVIDEFGGADGLVTIEDLVEQIVGDIEDEYDATEEASWVADGEAAYLCDARAEIDLFEKAVGVRLRLENWEEDDVETLGGLVFMISGRVPERGEVIAHPAGHEFEVVDADPRRIKRLRVTLRGGPALESREAAQ